jgi:Peptidase_C39 like family
MDFQSVFGDAPPDVPPPGADDGVDVPVSSDVLPDGEPTLVIGDVSRYADFNHQQGDNPEGFQGTCGLCSCGDILNQFGTNVTEADIVNHAVQNQECDVTDDPSMSGGTTTDEQVKILSDYHVPAHTEHQQSLEDLAGDVERGHGVIVEANAGYLWNDASAFENGQANHAVVVTGVARDPETGQIQGFYINDSGDGQAAKFVDADTMTKAWADTGGTCVVTDVVHVDTPTPASAA